MTRFHFPRLRVREARPSTLYRVGETATASTTVGDSHEGLTSTSQHDDSVVFHSDSSCEAQLPLLFTAIDDELDRLAKMKYTGTHKYTKSTTKNKKKKPASQCTTNDTVAAPQEHPPSQAVLLELQSSIDFLTTKLQQSESHVKALQAENNQLQTCLDDFLKQQDTELLKDDPSSNAAEENTVGLFGVKLQWPSFGSTKESEVRSRGNIKSTNETPDALSVAFTKEDAIETMTHHYHEQVQKLVGEKADMHTKIQHLQVQNTVQAETMASLEHQISKDRQMHTKIQHLQVQNTVQAETMASLEHQISKDRQHYQSYYDQENTNTIQQSDSRASRNSYSSGKRRASSKEYWHQVAREQKQQSKGDSERYYRQGGTIRNSKTNRSRKSTSRRHAPEAPLENHHSWDQDHQSIKKFLL